MKKRKILSFLALVILISSCQKKDLTRAKVSDEQVSSATSITDLQNYLKPQMAIKDYNDLDWSKTRIKFVNEDGISVTSEIHSKSHPNTSVYFSIVNGKAQAYLTTINLFNGTGTIEINSVDNKPLRAFAFTNNKITTYKDATDVVANNVPQDGPPTSGWLPDCIVTCTTSTGMPFSYTSMLYTYGGGNASQFYQTNPGAYGSGGYYSSPYYDRYAPTSADVDLPSIRRYTNDANPNYPTYKFKPQIISYPTYDQYIVTDNKTYTIFNVEIRFQLDKNKKLISNMTQVTTYGVVPMSYSMTSQQDPQPLYGTNSLVFSIQGKITYGGIVSIKTNISVNVLNIGGLCTVDIGY
jgi:hypothetical protein